MNQTWPILHPRPFPVITENLGGKDHMIAECSKSSCIRPDLYLDGGRSCDCCDVYPVCLSHLRTHSSEGKNVKKTQPKESQPVELPPPDRVTEVKAEHPVEERVTSVEDAPPKKRRGRPPGSKNKPK